MFLTLLFISFVVHSLWVLILVTSLLELHMMGDKADKHKQILACSMLLYSLHLVWLFYALKS